MRPIRVAVAGVLALGAVLWGGCTKSLPATSLTPAVSVTPSASASTVDLSGTRKDAVDVVIKYRALIDELRQQRNPDVNRLLTVSRKSAYDSWGYTLQDDFVNGDLQVGASVLTIRAVKSASYSNQWIVVGCVDYTHLDIVSRTTGKSVRTDSPTRKDLTDFTVEQDQNTKAWFVIVDEVKGSC